MKAISSVLHFEVVASDQTHFFWGLLPVSEGTITDHMHSALSSDRKYIGLAFNYLKPALAQQNATKITLSIARTLEYQKKTRTEVGI